MVAQNRKTAAKKCKRSTRTQLTMRRRGPVAADSRSGLLRDWLVGSLWTISESNYRFFPERPSTAQCKARISTFFVDNLTEKFLRTSARAALWWLPDNWATTRSALAANFLS